MTGIATFAIIFTILIGIIAFFIIFTIESGDLRIPDVNQCLESSGFPLTDAGTSVTLACSKFDPVNYNNYTGDITGKCHKEGWKSSWYLDKSKCTAPPKYTVLPGNSLFFARASNPTTIPATSLDDCGAKCVSNGACDLFSYDGTTCSSYVAIGKDTAIKSYIYNGSKWSNAINGDFNDFDIVYDEATKFKSVDGCKADCEKNTLCNHITNKPQEAGKQSCWLKGHDAKDATFKMGYKNT